MFSNIQESYSYLLLQYRHLKEQGISDKPSISPHNHQSDQDKCLLDVYIEVINTIVTLVHILLIEHSYIY